MRDTARRALGGLALAGCLVACGGSEADQGVEISAAPTVESSASPRSSAEPATSATTAVATTTTSVAASTVAPLDGACDLGVRTTVSDNPSIIDLMPGAVDAGPIVLTPRPPVGSTWTGTFEVVVKAAEGPVALQLIVDWTAVVTECDERGSGGWSAVRTIENARISGAIETVDPDVSASVSELVGLAYTTDYDRRGAFIFERFDIEQLSAETSYVLWLELDRYFSYLMPTMPMGALGEGATWTIDLAKDRTPTSALYEVELDRISDDGQTAELSFSQIDDGLNATGSMVVDPSQALPVSATAQLIFEDPRGEVVVDLALLQTGR